jgi:hypothetical protein
MEDRAEIREMKMATLQGSSDIVLRFIFKTPVKTGAVEAAATPSLVLTPQQARHLLLLLGQGLGRPGSDIPDGPSGKQPH